MASIDELSGLIGGDIQQSDETHTSVEGSKGHAEELASQFQSMNADRQASGAEEVKRLLEEAQGIQASVKAKLEEARTAAEALKGGSGLQSGSSGLVATGKAVAAFEPPAAVRRLGDQLPVWRKRQPARAFVYSAEDGVEVEFTSGRDDSAAAGLTDGFKNRWVVTDHIEGKLGARMRQPGGARHVSMVINKEPCEGPLGCDATLPGIIPEGSTVSVYVRDADGVREFGTYRGTGEGIA